MWTYAELAPKFGVSAERVRQIEQKVMNKLRTPEFAHLSNYLPKYSLDDDDDDDLFDDTPPRPNYVNRPGSGRSTRGP